MTQAPEEYKREIEKHLGDLREVFARAAVGDFSKDVPIPDRDDDELMEFFIGLQIMVEVIREKIKSLESEIEIRKQKEALINKRSSELSEEKARQEAFLLSIGDGIVVVDREGKVVFINDFAYQMIEYNPDDLIGKQWGKNVPQVQDKEGKLVPYEKTSTYEALQVGKTSIATYFYTKKTGLKIPVSVSSAPVIMEGRIQGAVSVVRDVSREIELEQMKDEFVSMASHELRTPMTAMKGIISMMFAGRYGQVNENLKEPLTDISVSVDRLIRMVNDILSISKFESRQLKLRLEPIQLLSLVNEITKNMTPLFEQKKLTLTLTVPQDITVLADRAKLTQIFDNLLGNAVKFTDKGGVTIIATVKGRFVEIEIKDTGVGIADEDKEKLFQRFQQVSSGLARPAGTGLGLYISREFASKMGGDVTLAYSKVGVGSGFLLMLPRYK